MSGDWEIGSRGLEIGNRGLEIGDWRLGIGDGEIIRIKNIITKTKFNFSEGSF
jgi:hypothetical protein